MPPHEILGPTTISKRLDFFSKNRLAIYPFQYLKINSQDAFTTIYRPHSHLSKAALYRQEGVIGFQNILVAVKYNTSHRELTSLSSPTEHVLVYG